MSYDLSRNLKSIQVYNYKKSFQHSFKKIEEKILNDVDPKYPITLFDDDVGNKFTRFEFKMLDHNSDNLLIFSVIAHRDILDSTPYEYYHNVCFTKNGFLLLTGMEYRNTILRYISMLLHNTNYIFKPKFFAKSEIEAFTKKLVKKNVNKIYRPRFHFSEKYRHRKFNDFYVDEITCATDDPEYDKMFKKCDYFEPIFKLKSIIDNDVNTTLKLNHEGRLYISLGLNIDDWLTFIQKYFPQLYGAKN